MAQDLRLRSIELPADLKEHEIQKLVAFAICKDAQDVTTRGDRLVWHVDSHWNPTGSVVHAELRRMRPPA